MASTTLDLPDPFGPTTTVTPGSNLIVFGSANDLKPLRVSDFKNTAGPTLVAATPPPREPSAPPPGPRPAPARPSKRSGRHSSTKTALNAPVWRPDPPKARSLRQDSALRGTIRR